MTRVVLESLVSLDLEQLSAELIELGSNHEGFFDLPQRVSSGIGDLAARWGASQKENSGGHISPRLLSARSPSRQRPSSPGQVPSGLKRKRGSAGCGIPFGCVAQTGSNFLSSALTRFTAVQYLALPSYELFLT